MIESRLAALAGTARIVVVTGLPGTGKSVLVNRLAHAAHAAGRVVHLLQWDVARPVFEACPDGRRYPMRDGVTHPVVRKAAGLWARAALAGWQVRCAGAPHVLVGEAPLVGHRFVELARPAPDPAESLLAQAEFLIAVPTAEMRRRLADARRERMRGGGAGREREDALPSVLDALWLDVRRAGETLGLCRAGGAAARSTPAYDPDLYEAVYRAALARRRASALRLDQWRVGGPASAYAFSFVPADVVPGDDEAATAIRTVEARYPDLGALEAEMARWYEPAASAG